MYQGRTQRGVSLMELMVVMVIVGILSAIAFPTYRNYVLRTQRTNAKTALTQTAQNLERCFTRFSRYDDDGNCPIADTLINDGGFDSEGGTYAITGALTPTGFALTATPQAGQADDRCGTLTLNQINQAAASGGTVQECWAR